MMNYTVGMTIERKSHQVEVEAEDALIAALKAKAERPEALIVYVRKANARADRRHPHEKAAPKGLPKRGRAAQRQLPVRSAERPPRQPRAR